MSDREDRDRIPSNVLEDTTIEDELMLGEQKIFSLIDSIIDQADSNLRRRK